MRLVLSTSNILSDGASIVRRSRRETSSLELLNSLQANLLNARTSRSLSSTPQNEKASTVSIPFTQDDGTLASWILQRGETLYIPSPKLSAHSLVENRSEYDITMKIFFLPGWNTNAAVADSTVSDAVQLVLDELDVTYLDLVIASFTGITFDADDDDDDDINEPEQPSKDSTLDECSQSVDTPFYTYWASLEKIHAEQKAKKLGIAEFGASRLSRFISHLSSNTQTGASNIRPSVNQLNVRDCCVVPKRLLDLALQHHIELLTHNDCTNIMKPGTLRSLLSGGIEESSDKSGTISAKVVSNDSTNPSPTPLVDGLKVLTHPSGGLEMSEEGSVFGTRLQGNVVPRFVVKYTAVLKNQGVVENKGYFVVADLEGERVTTGSAE